jgi:hypothetical protein
MNLDINEVYSFKIANGDEVVAKIVEINHDNFVVQSPLTVVPGPQGLQLMPSLFTAELDVQVTVNKSNCAMIAPARDQIRDKYIEATTGIKPVRSQILTG